MGITTSKKYIAFEDYKKPFKEKDKDLIKKINEIASKMILETSSQEILKFLEPNYCNSIIQILTNILKKNYTENKIKAIHSLIKNHKSLETNILDLNKIEIGKEEITRPKKIFCEEVAIYYVKFSHLYSAIYHVINPILNDEEVSLENLTFCKKRDMENNVEELINKDKSNINVIVSNHFCDINKKTKISNNEISHTYLKKLGEESGIKELDDLYKDKYDPIKKKFFMSKESKKEYSAVLTKIYKTFTGEELPDDIKHFKDVPLYRYEKKKMCTTKELDFKTGYVGTIADNDILKYIEHIKEIMDITYKNNEKFIKILDEMFKKDEATNEIIINDEFTMDELDKKTKEVRKFIVSMYIDCEKNFRKGIKLFKKIVLNSKLKKIIKMEKADIKPKISYDYDYDKEYRDPDYKKEIVDIIMERDKNKYYVEKLVNVEKFLDRIISDAPSSLHDIGFIFLLDFYNYLKKNTEDKKNYHGYCFPLISEFLYCLLFCDIRYLVDKNHHFYSLFINLLSQEYADIGENIINYEKKYEYIKKDINLYEGIHFKICCDGECRNKNSCEEKCEELYICFIKGERWSYTKEDGDTIDLCGKCYYEFEKFKDIDDLKDLNKSDFQKKKISDSFLPENGCSDMVRIVFPNDLIKQGMDFRSNWYNLFDKKNWKELINEPISYFRVMTDVKDVVKKYEGISIMDDREGVQYEITNIGVDRNNDTIVTVKMNDDRIVILELKDNIPGEIIIFPKITKDEYDFLAQFLENIGSVGTLTNPETFGKILSPTQKKHAGIRGGEDDISDASTDILEGEDDIAVIGSL